VPETESGDSPGGWQEKGADSLGGS
jgi:hypothetical protein